MNDFLKSVGARLRTRRQRLNLTQISVARTANRSKQLVSAWENGRAEMTATALAKVSQALDVDPGWLLSGDNQFHDQLAPSRGRQREKSSEGHSANGEKTELALVYGLRRDLTMLKRENFRLRGALSALLSSQPFSGDAAERPDA